MQRAMLMMAALLTAGCAGSERLEQAPKEVYVEAQRVDVTTNRIGFPLDPRSEDRGFSAVRNFISGRAEGRRKLGALLGQYPEDRPDEAVGEPEGDPSGQPSGDEFELDLSEFPDREPPSMLVFPDLEHREESAVYIGHSAFRRPIYAPGRQFVHHLRFLIVNRHPRAVRLHLTDVTLEVPAIGSDGEAVAGTERERLATANHAGGRLDTLVVEPGHARLGHVFFEDGRLPSALLVRLQLAMAHDPDDPSAPHVSWEFGVNLVRRFVIPEGVISEVESRVAHDQELREIRDAKLEPWMEPRLAPVAAPAGGSGGGAR